MSTAVKPRRACTGSVKVWAHLNRQAITVAKCTVERAMRANGWEGVRRVKRVRTAVADPAHDRAPDLVQRRFWAPAPCRLLVADLTYVRMATGCLAYTAFVIEETRRLLAFCRRRRCEQADRQLLPPRVPGAGRRRLCGSWPPTAHSTTDLPPTVAHRGW